MASNTKTTRSTRKNDIQKLNTANEVLTETNNLLDNVAKAQDNTLNQGFVFIGTSKELQKANLTTKRLLGKTKLNLSAIDESKFKKIDIRKETVIEVNGKSPVILSQMPEGSYHWIGNSLYIDNPTRFWSITTFLVIKTK